nr:uncharacterized protein LOC131797158 [Pocillopora verrucosa]
MELCLRRCSIIFQANDAELSGEKVPVDHFCYAKCIEKEGKQHSPMNERSRLVTAQNTSSIMRIKRDVPNSQRNQTSLNTSVVSERIKPTYPSGEEYPEWLLRCLGNKSRVEKSFTTDDVETTYEELNNTGRYIATISWTPFDIQLTNWTGYGIIYAIIDFTSDNDAKTHCQELDKNATNITITNSSYGMMNDSYLVLYITSLPYPVHMFYDFPILCEVPTPCVGELVQTTQSTVHATHSTDSDKKGTAIIAAVLSTIVAIVLIGLIVFYCRRRPLPPTLDPEFEYDAFIIFSSEDSQWVINTLIPTLEENHGMKCCVHYRDFTPGVTFRKNMVDSVYKCKKTIAVVSTHFFNSKYCGSELDYALHRLMEKRDDSLVVIKIDDVDRRKLPKELQKLSYIDYAKSVEKESWEKKLVDCLSYK